jgi:hypothetical protein
MNTMPIWFQNKVQWAFQQRNKQLIKLLNKDWFSQLQ